MRVNPTALARVIKDAPKTLLVFRLIVGYTHGEFAAAASEVAQGLGLTKITASRVKSIEAGRNPSDPVAKLCAETIHRLMTGIMWPVGIADFRSKLDKPDTEQGWETVRRFAKRGVPYLVLLHQRLYGGAFRALLDATSTRRGEILLEEPVTQLLTHADVPYLRTGPQNQAEIASRFGITVRPAPDFVVFEGTRTLRAMVECKQANDGGTARDKASRFRSLAAEASRLGGVPVFAVLDGLGWQRTADALGPVIRDTDGRVFTLKTLPHMLTVQPFPGLVGKSTAVE